MSSWSCPHDLNGICQKVSGARCDPGMRGCVLHGRYVFAKHDTEPARKPVKATPAVGAKVAPAKPRRRLPF